MRRAPVRALAVDEPAPGEELEDVMARLENLALEGLAAAHDIAHPLLGLAGNANRGELAGAVEPGEVGRIALVVFPLDARPLWDERWRDHVARVPPLAQRSVQHVSSAAGLVTNA